MKRKEKETKPADQRSHSRHLLDLPIEYYRADLKPGRVGYILNISQEGLAVDLPEKLEAGENLKLKLFHADQGSIEIITKIVWINLPPTKEETYRSGVNITKLSIENRCKWEMLLAKANT